MPAETLASLLAWAKVHLAHCEIDTPGLDARLLLQHATALDHSALIADPERPVSDGEAALFGSLVGRRCRREPVSRILGFREFYGREFQLGNATLDPRPDTETLVEAALAQARALQEPRILDLGTGTGAIAITLLAELPQAMAVATDLSHDALEIAAANAQKYAVSARLRLIQGPWYGGISDCFDLIISNPPYLQSERIEQLEPEVKDWDPRIALDGGPDGLDAYRHIAAGADTRLLPLGKVLVEIGEGQGRDVVNLFAACDFHLKGWHRDLGGHVRCLAFQRDKLGVGNAADLSYIPSR